MPSALSTRRSIFIAGSLLAAGLAATAPARAQDKPAPAVITVSAEGTSAIAPDMAVINLSILREADTARAALDANTQAMAGLLAAMREEGIAERDLQTANFSIQPRWVYPQPKEGEVQVPFINGYTVTNGLTVRIRDLARLGTILDVSVTLGVNQGGEIVFTNDNPDATRDAARKAAVERAIAKARLLTEAAGVKLGRVTQISEQSFEQPPMPMMRAEMGKVAMAADAAPVPIAAGENEYRVTVSMSWEIKE